MKALLTALIEMTGLRRFFSGVVVELPAYLLPNFRVVEIPNLKRNAQSKSPTGR
jgi:hypothetical protein